MLETPSQKRAARAEQLADRHPFAAEILSFYVHVARFQEALHHRLEGSRGLQTAREWAGRPLDSRRGAGATDGFAHSATDPDLLVSFPPFLALVEEKAPPALSQIAGHLRESDSSLWADLLMQSWDNIESPTDPKEFLALAFLQPHAELIRARSGLQLEGYTLSLCPFCNRNPALGVLRQQGDGGRRSLLCGFCLTEWEFRRVVCPGCGQEDHAKLPVYTSETFPHIRVECCDTCQTYIKSIDLTKNGLADPFVDELASIPLNLWAHEHGYDKLRPNLLGM